MTLARIPAGTIRWPVDLVLSIRDFNIGDDRVDFVFTQDMSPGRH